MSPAGGSGRPGTGDDPVTGADASAASAAERLRRRLLADIEAEELRPGDKLGAERALAARYEVSRGPVRQVLAALAEAGIVDRLPGRSGGTFIGRPKVERDMGSIVGLPHYLARQGFTAETTVLEARIDVVTPRVAETLQLAPDALVFLIRRLRLADRRPISLEHAHLPADRFPRLLEHPLGGSLYALLEREFGATPGEAEEDIEVVNATGEESALLGVAEGDPLLLIRRTSYDEQGRPMEHSKDLFRGDRTRISVRTSGRGIRSRVRSDGGRVELRNG